MLALLWEGLIGLIVGVMGQKMIDENLKAQQEKLSDLEAKPPGRDR